MNLQLSYSKESEGILGVVMSDGIYCRDLYLYTKNTIIPALVELSSTVALILDMTHAHWVSPNGLFNELEACVKLYDDYDIDIITFVSKEPAINSLIMSIYQHHTGVTREYHTATSVEQAYELVLKSRSSSQVQ